MESGYGQFHNGIKNVVAHRFAYELEHGPVPEGMLCCHHCDNRKCVRHSHIFLGTHHDNMMDAVGKGRVKPKEFCYRGHRLEGNSEIRTDKDGHKFQSCLLCRKINISLKAPKQRAKRAEDRKRRLEALKEVA